jgi:putative redox protein
MEVTIEHLGAVQFEIRARQHTIASDQPEESGGFDEGMTPPELMLASLGACEGYYAAQYLRKKGLATEGLRIRVTADKKTGPARLDDFKVQIDLPVACGEEHKKGVEQAVHSCLIHNTLEHPPKITISIKDGSMAKAA